MSNILKDLHSAVDNTLSKNARHASTRIFPGLSSLLVLKILARRDTLHGYGVTVRIEEISEDVLHIEEGSLCPALHRLEEAG